MLHSQRRPARTQVLLDGVWFPSLSSEILIDASMTPRSSWRHILKIMHNTKYTTILSCACPVYTKSLVAHEDLDV